MSDSTAIEAIASAIVELGLQSSEGAAFDAHVILAALRDAGFEIYRPDECHRIVIDNAIGIEGGPWRMVVDWNVGEAYLETDLADGRYWLVPVGGETK